jgi:cell division protein FtsB
MDLLGRKGQIMSGNRTQAKAPFWRRHLLAILALGLLALGIHDIFGAHGYLAMRSSEKQIEELRGEIQRLNEENQQLTEHVNALKTDPEAIEKVAREQMGLARPGELIFKLPPAESGGADSGERKAAPGSR